VAPEAAVDIRVSEKVGLILRSLLISIVANKVNRFFVKIDGETECFETWFNWFSM
jgi:hypothetical protein